MSISLSRRSVAVAAAAASIGATAAIGFGYPTQSVAWDSTSTVAPVSKTSISGLDIEPICKDWKEVWIGGFKASVCDYNENVPD